MPIFISYSHADRQMVHKLAAKLVEHNAHVWVDSWELNVGDSIVARVQEAIQDSDALLVVLSKASVTSEWCKKELNAGLIRELEEKRVLVLPVLLEDCEIPMFLRDKMYADFRGNFSVGMKALIEAVSRVTTADQGRILSDGTNVDWSETWGYDDEGFFHMDYTLVETSADRPFTLLTEISLKCNVEATRRYKQYEEAGLGWMGRLIVTEALPELAGKEEIKLLLSDQRPVTDKFRLMDIRSAAGYDIIVHCRRLGEDNGKDQLVRVTNYLHKIAEYVRRAVRKLTPDELARVRKIMATR
jgi:hypothetical protein